MNIPPKINLAPPLQQWLDSLPAKVSLQASSDLPKIQGRDLNYWMAESQLPEGSLIAALLWLRIGMIDRAHEIVQAGTTPISSYLHGVVHRIEGDFMNANYWFRRTKDSHVEQSLSEWMEQRLGEEGLHQSASDFQIMQGSRFEPIALVRAIEKLGSRLQSREHIDAVQILERICWFEWTGLWEIVLQ